MWYQEREVLDAQDFIELAKLGDFMALKRMLEVMACVLNHPTPNFKHVSEYLYQDGMAIGDSYHDIYDQLIKRLKKRISGIISSTFKFDGKTTTVNVKELLELANFDDKFATQQMVLVMADALLDIRMLIPKDALANLKRRINLSSSDEQRFKNAVTSIYLRA